MGAARGAPGLHKVYARLLVCVLPFHPHATPGVHLVEEECEARKKLSGSLPSGNFPSSVKS